jgi:hypothetical protein
VPTKSGALVNKHLAPLWRWNNFVRRGYLFDPMQPRPVELHVTLWDSPWRGLDLLPVPDVWARAQRVEFDGLDLRVLSRPDTLVHLGVHFATHLVEREARLGQAIDLARFLNHSSGERDWAQIVRVSDSARVMRLVYLALRTTHALTGAPLPPPAILDTMRLRTPARLRAWAEHDAARDVLAMDFRNPDLRRAYALTFAAAASRREKLRVLRFAFFPSLDALQAEYGARSRWLYARHLAERGRVYWNARRQRRANGN